MVKVPITVTRAANRNGETALGDHLAHHPLISERSRLTANAVPMDVPVMDTNMAYAVPSTATAETRMHIVEKDVRSRLDNAKDQASLPPSSRSNHHPQDRLQNRPAPRNRHQSSRIQSYPAQRSNHPPNPTLNQQTPSRIRNQRV